MTHVLTLLLLFAALCSYGQAVKIDTLKLPPSIHFSDIQSSRMNYPIIRTGQATIDTLINTHIKDRFTDNGYPNLPIKEALIKWAGDGLIFLDFEITFNKNGVVSLNISAEGCGAYCTNWTEYYNYSTITGKPLDISYIIDTLGGFRDIVYKDFRQQFHKAKEELKQRHLDPEENISIDEYESAIGYYIESETTFNLETYKLSSDTIEIIKVCYLPHVMKPLIPVFELKYSYGDIQKFLRTNSWP